MFKYIWNKLFCISKDIADIYLFDGKGYEKSVSFDHSLIKNINFDKEVMIAGNIQINENLENFKKIADIIDISGGLETSGLKDISKIETFLQKIKNLDGQTSPEMSPCLEVILLTPARTLAHIWANLKNHE